jgi:type I restriction enzyme S subunit
MGYRSSGGKFKRSDFFTSEFPEKWKVDKLHQEIKIGSGFPFNSENYSSQGRYRVITIKNVQDGYLNLDSQNRIDIDESIFPKHCLLSRGDILVSLTGNVGRVAIVDSEGHVLNQRVGVILTDSHWKNFAYLYLLLPEVRERLINIANGSSQDNLSPLDIFNDYFPIPPVELLEEFNLIVGPIINMITESQIEITKLKEIQTWALPLLMNSQLLFSKQD